jgi:hypothetical protein|tara:strand:- start:510 stop:650 length:141 start_codon:yes stop_codon:yes gene_type:complete
MKVTITIPKIIKKSTKVVDIKQTNGSAYEVLSITLKKKDNVKTLFI